MSSLTRGRCGPARAAAASEGRCQRAGRRRAAGSYPKAWTENTSIWFDAIGTSIRRPGPRRSAALAARRPGRISPCDGGSPVLIGETHLTDTVGVRYVVDDVQAALDFYTKHLG